MDDAPPAPAVEAAGDGGVPPLDRLLRPPDRIDAWRAALARVREVDRRLLIGVVCAVVAVVGIVVAVSSRSAAPTDAAVTLPRAQPDDAAGPGDPATEGGGALGGATTTTTGPVVVDVAGAVMRPGLVSVPAGGRVADAIAAAGGFRPDADTERVNLASPLSDGVRVYVAAVGQASIPVPIGPNGGGGGGAGATPGGGDASGTSTPEPVNLNTATADELDTLPGVGPSTAQAILAYRTAHGSFASVDDLDQVRGIGPAKLSQLRDLVTVG